MGAVFAAFGIDWRLLLIEVVNFGLLLLALWYFLYAPLMAMLERRRQLVVKGIEDAHEAAEKLGEIEHSRAAVLAGAGKEADEVLKAAREAAHKKETELVAAADARAAALLKDAERQSQELKAQALNESRQEVAKLIVLGIEKTAHK